MKAVLGYGYLLAIGFKSDSHKPVLAKSKRGFSRQRIFVDR
jgi:hypothetical protein